MKSDHHKNLGTRIREFLTAIVGSWASGMSGAPSVPLAIAALFVSNEKLKFLFGSLAIICGLLAAFLVWSRENERAIAVENKLQDENPLPDLNIQIKEASIEPHHGSADCFIRVSIHNLTRHVPTSISSYKLTLKIGGKLFSSDRPRSVNGFSAAHWDYDDEAAMGYREYKAADEILEPLLVPDAGLERGKERTGWLRFSISPVPKWPSTVEPTGNVDIWHDDEGEEHYYEETLTTLSSKTVEQVTLEVRDPFGQWHSATKEKPLAPLGRTVVETPPVKDASKLELN